MYALDNAIMYMIGVPYNRWAELDVAKLFLAVFVTVHTIAPFAKTLGLKHSP
jgi:hypothetical protein